MYRVCTHLENSREGADLKLDVLKGRELVSIYRDFLKENYGLEHFKGLFAFPKRKSFIFVSQIMNMAIRMKLNCDE